jgi:A/G-specific adenine glycosylase
MALETDLISWYGKARRHMPWREDPLPYHVYLSEIMLQQTQVDTVRAYYLRFLAKFPTINDLAQGSEEEVLKLWEGLGYYSRGRNLHQAALVVAHSFHGEIPSAKEDLLSLPGIGEYTSRAIRAIAFHQKEIAVDGNLIRVYSRLAEDKEDRLETIKAHCEAYFKAALQREDPSSFNQALMDLGEMICLPKGLPLCEKCPLRAYCESAKDGTMLEYPTPKKAKEKKREDWTVLLLETKDEIALLKRPEEGLLASLYQFPMIEGKRSESEIEAFLEGQGITPLSLERIGEKEHVFSHLVWDLRGYRIRLAAKPAQSPYLWVPKKALKEAYPFPSAFSFFKKQID